MPGFLVGGIGPSVDSGEGAPGRFKLYYSYTWKIITLFDTGAQTDPVLILLKDASLPTFTVDKERVIGSSLEYKFAKSVSWDDIKVTWYDTEGLLSKIQAWRKSVWTQDAGLQPASSYKKHTVLASELPDNTSVNEWDLYNSWPSIIRHSDLTYDNSDAKYIEVTITYDWAEETPSGQ